MKGWQGVLGIKALTREQWDILEALVHYTAREEFGTSSPTVDELGLAARALLRRFGEAEELRQHVRTLSRRADKMASEERVPVRWKGQLVGHLVDVVLEGPLGFADWSGRWVPLETSDSKVGGPTTNAFLRELENRGRLPATVGAPGEAMVIDFKPSGGKIRFSRGDWLDPLLQPLNAERRLLIRWRGREVGSFVGAHASTFIPGQERFKGTWEPFDTPETRFFLAHLDEAEKTPGGGHVNVDPPREYRQMWFARGHARGGARVLLRS